MSVSKTCHVCHRWHTQCGCSSCWEWKLWLWRTQRGGSMAASVLEISCSLRITLTCQDLLGRTHCVGTMMTGTAQELREVCESKAVQLLPCPTLSCNINPGLEFDSPACRMRTIVTWGLWPSKQQRSRAVTASCRKGFTACCPDQHMRLLLNAKPCRHWGQMLWVSTVPSSSLNGILPTVRLQWEVHVRDV